MPIRTRFSTKGFEEALERLANMGQDIDAIADEGLTAAGKVFEAGFQQRVPVGSGNLRDHLGATPPKRDGDRHYIVIGMLPDTDPDTARYGIVQEFGAAHTEKHPYIRPTLDADTRKAREALKQALEGHLK